MIRHCDTLRFARRFGGSIKDIAFIRRLEGYPTLDDLEIKMRTDRHNKAGGTEMGGSIITSLHLYHEHLDNAHGIIPNAARRMVSKRHPSILVTLSRHTRTPRVVRLESGSRVARQHRNAAYSR